jgi:hypothetical protein
VDNDGNALIVGALYFNTTINKMKTWTGSSWSITFSDSSAASAITNDSSVSGANVKLALETLDNGKAGAASAFGTDNRMLRSDGTGKNIQASGIDLDDNDVMTTPGRIISTKNGALDAPTVSVTGTPVSGGSATTTKPLVLLEHGGAATTAWNTGGTVLGINVPNSFAGCVIDIQRNGSSLLFWSSSTAWRCGSNFALTGSGTTLSWTGSGLTALHSPAAATLQMGGYDAAAPVAQTLRIQGSRAGTDTNIGGGNLTIQSGNGTGTGTISSIILQSPVAVASGTGAQTRTTGLTIINGTARLSSYTSAARPSATTSGAGALVYVSDLAGGAAPQYSDGSAWQSFGSTATTPIPMYGLTMSNNSTDATNDIDVAAGGCSDDTYAGRLTMSATCVKQLDVVFAEYSSPGTASGGRASADNTTGAKWFHVFLIGGSGKNTQPFFATSLTPSLPSGFTTKRRIGSIYWTGSTIRGFIQMGDLFVWKATVQDFNSNATETRTNRTVSVPGGVRCVWWGVVGSNNTNAGYRAYISTPDINDATVGIANAQLSIDGTSGYAQADIHVPTDTSSQVAVRGSVLFAIELNAKGYRDLGIGD